MAKSAVTEVLAKVFRVAAYGSFVAGLWVSAWAFCQTQIQCGQIVSCAIDARYRHGRCILSANAVKPVTAWDVKGSASFTAQIQLCDPHNLLRASDRSGISRLARDGGIYCIVVREFFGAARR